ncbi:MAG: hypothetical protein JWM74_2309, partial [Myxococcaceae bacterium]|nr:hypothetical protein [Myxococcaceae bacterium]
MSTAEDDLYSPASDYMPRGCELGTVGWANREEHVDFGTGDNDGFTFVMVTLYAGKTPGEKPTAGLAQGREILCGVNSLAGTRIPKKGTRVYVLYPSGMEDADGAGVIVATVEKTATKDALAKDRVVVDYGDDVHLVLRAKSVSLQDPDNR